MAALLKLCSKCIYCGTFCLICVCVCVFCVQISLETEYLGPRRVEAFRREDEDWQRKAHTAVLSIQDLTVKYFETTARAQKGI